MHSLATTERPSNSEIERQTPPIRRHSWLRLALYGCGFTLAWTLVDYVSLLWVDVSLYEVVWTRYAVHLMLMLVVFGPKYHRGLVRTEHPVRQIVRSLLMLGMPVCFIWGLSYMPGNDVMALFWTTPLLLLVATYLITRERLSWQVPVAALGGFVGVIMILRPAFAIHKSAILPLGMAACFVLYLIMTRALRQELLVSKLFHTALWVFIALTPFIPLFWGRPSLRALAAMCTVGILGWVALYFLDRAVDHAPPAVLGPILYSSLLWSELLQWIVTGTRPSPVAIGGSVLVLAAVAIGLRARWHERTWPGTTTPGYRASQSL